MKRVLLLFAFLLILTTVNSTNATTINVDVGDFYFSPVSFDAAVGDTIRWTLSAGSHTTTSTSVPAGAATWDYTFTGIGNSFDYVVTQEGVYEYICSFHPTTMIASFSTQVALPFVENFDFPVDDNLTMHGWVAHSAGGTNPITVNNGGLTFANYPSSGIGNAALVDNTSEDIHRLFENVTNGPVYLSFMVNVVNNPVGYFIHYAPNPHNTFDFRGRVWVKGTAPALAFGLSYASSDTIVTAPVYSLNTTYLVVVKYEVVTGDFNDIVSLYVFSDADPFPVTEPTPTLGPLANATTSADIIPGSVNIRQYNSAQNFIVDGIRIGTNWVDVVPVELTSFTAETTNGTVTLNWSTATETNNSGFELQRKDGSNDFTEIGFIPGYGTTSENKSYSFVDGNLAAGNYTYRLKQIDFDGTFSYSNEVDVVISSPAQFELAQNFPNPFNPSTKINFNLAVDSKVSLKVFNIVGQEVATLINSNLVAGVNSINFDASELNSGVYLYRLEASGIDGSNFVAVKKMTLIK